MKLFWISAFGTALGMTLTKIPPMPDIDQISTDEVIFVLNSFLNKKVLIMNFFKSLLVLTKNDRIKIQSCRNLTSGQNTTEKVVDKTPTCLTLKFIILLSGTCLKIL